MSGFAAGLHIRAQRTVSGSKFWNADLLSEQSDSLKFRPAGALYNVPSVLFRVTALLALVSLIMQSPPAESQTGASRVALATVLDPKNHPILDVGVDDFVIQESGAAREVLSVRPADYPIVLMLDTGTDARGDFPMIRKAAAHFLERVGQRPVAVGTFGGTPTLVAGLEDDREAVTARIAGLAAPTNAPSALLQGAALAAQTIRATGALFSAIVVLSSSSLDASGGSLDPMIASIIDSNAILHVVANRAVQATAGGFRPAAAIRALAEQSRGEFTVIYSAASFQSALDTMADRLSSELMIEYIVPVGSKPNDVKLGVRLVGAHVRGLGVAPK
jgi:hypothetical protein